MPSATMVPSSARRTMSMSMSLPGARHSADVGRPSQAYAVSAIISKGTTSTEPPETTRVASV